MRLTTLLLITSLTAQGLPLRAQTLVTSMGRIMYYNSLDSARGVLLNRVAARAYCLLQHSDTTHTIRLKLDLAAETDSIRGLGADTTRYFLGYDNLTGNAASFSDSALLLAGDQAADLGVYIRARDTIINEEKILRLVDWGIQHYAALQKIRTGEPPPGQALIEQIFAQKPSLRLRRLLQFCR